MAKAIINQKFVDNLPSTNKTIKYWCSINTGFGVRLTASGVASYVMMYRDKYGKQKEFTIARCDRVDFIKALRRFHDLYQTDPNLDKHYNKTIPTLEEAFNIFQQSLYCQQKQSDSTRTKEAAIFNNHIKAILGSMHLDQIDKQHVKFMFDSVRKIDKQGNRTNQPSPSVANRAVKIISQIYNSTGYIGISGDFINPTKWIKLHKENKDRGRSLEESELSKFSYAFNKMINEPMLDKQGKPMLIKQGDKKGQPIPIGDVAYKQRIIAAQSIKLMTFTGKRPGEVLGAKITEINLSKELWLLPAERTKTKVAEAIPLNKVALQVIKDAIEFSKEHGDGIHLFPSLTHKGQHVKDIRKSFDRFKHHLGAPDITPNYLRKNYGTYVLELSNDLLSTSKLLGHARVSTTEEYYLRALESKKAAASNKFADFVTDLNNENDNKVTYIGNRF